MSTQWDNLNDGDTPVRRDRTPLLMGLIAFGSVGLVGLCGGLALLVWVLSEHAVGTNPVQKKPAASSKANAFSDKDKIIMRGKYKKYCALLATWDKADKDSHTIEEGQTLLRELDVMNRDSVSQYGVECAELPSLFK